MTEHRMPLRYLQTKTAAGVLAMEVKAAAPPAAAAGVTSEDDPYTFWIIASVTGIVDEVNDLILPGAYTKTLARRMPKIIKDHDWAQRLGKTVEAHELMPGDARLPKTTARGAAWPAAAGALALKVVLFGETVAGREAAERWRQYGAEQEFSIGYQVPPGTATKNAAGNRVLPEIDLYETSDVLWGAMPLAGQMPVALAAKMLAAVSPADTADPDGEPVFEYVPTSQTRVLHARATSEIDWPQVEAASADAPGGLSAKVLLDLAGKAAGGADKNRGGAEQLRRWYVHGEGATLIGWNTPGDFTRCVAIAGKHMSTERAKGYCNLRHQDATGGPPGHGSAEGKGKLPPFQKAPKSKNGKPVTEGAKVTTEGGDKGTVSKVADGKVTVKLADGKSVTVNANTLTRTDADDKKPAFLRGKGYDPALEVGDLAGTVEPEVKAMGWSRLPGTWQERLAIIENAVSVLLRGDGRDDNGRTRYEWDDVRVEGTWDDRVCATRRNWDSPVPESADSSQTFLIDYHWDGDQVVFGEPQAAEITASVNATADDDDASLPATLPAALDEAAWAMKLLTGPVEGKAGRVLSAANQARMVASVESLLTVLAAAGVYVNAPAAPRDYTGGGAVTVDPESTAPSLNGKVLLDPAEVRAAIAGVTPDNMRADGSVLLDPSEFTASLAALQR